jgi:heptosyltransferase II
LYRILVVAPNWIGDALMAQPLLALLHQKHPGLQLDVLAPDWIGPVARRMPEVREVIAAPLRHGALQLGTRWRLARKIRSRRYDEALVLPNSWKAALVPFFAGIPVRTGYVGEARYGLLNKLYRDGKRAMRQHYARLAGEPMAIEAPHAALQSGGLEVPAAEIARTLEKFGVRQPYAVLCPGAEYGPAKRWPYFASLSSRIDLRAVLLGSTRDLEASKDIAGVNLVGKTTLDEAIQLIAGAAFVVSNDSGLMHVAAALGRPQVALFGSSSPLHTPPASPAARVLWLQLECSPCFARECPLGHFRCMREITVDSVVAQIQHLGS